MDNRKLVLKARGIARTLTYNEKLQGAAKQIINELTHRLWALTQPDGNRPSDLATKNVTCKVCNGSPGHWGHDCDPDGCHLATPDREMALNVAHPRCHEAANAFWNYWNANGETHRHGYYESTWGAINMAIRMVGVVPHDFMHAPLPDGSGSLGPENQPPNPKRQAQCVWPNCACDNPSKGCGNGNPAIARNND